MIVGGNVVEMDFHSQSCNQRVFIKDGEEVNVVVVKEPMISGVLR